MLHDDEWVDWFTWQEEGKDWRRTGGKRKLSATASKLAVPAEAAEAEAAAEEAGADQKAAKKAAVKKAGAVAGATAEGEMDEALTAALVEDCGECTNCLDKRKFGGPGLKKQKCKEPVPAGTRAAAAAAAAVALEARACAAEPSQVKSSQVKARQGKACAAEPKREPSFLGEPKREPSLLGEPKRETSLLGEPKREPSLFGEPKREPKCAPQVVVEASDAVAVCSAEADDAGQGKMSSADLSNMDIGSVSSYGLTNMDICAVSSAEADAAAANRSSRRNPKLVVGAVSITAGTPSVIGPSHTEAVFSQRHPIRRPRELAGLQDWIPSGKNWMPP
jgi:hypothetical protein